MALKHSSVGIELAQNEWESETVHEVDGQTENDIMAFIGGEWSCLTPTQVMALLGGQAAAAFSMNSQKITNVHDPVAAQDADTKAARDAAIAAHVGESDPHTQYQKESEKGAASGYASLNSSTKVVEQPASISDHVLDEDDMASNSDTKVPTQQSVKAYVGAQYFGLEALAADPTGTRKGQAYYNTVLERIRVCIQEYVPAGTADGYSGTGNGSTDTGATTKRLGQTFTPSSDYSCPSVKLYAYRSGVPTAVFVGIYATDENGFPTGSPIASTTVSGYVFGTSFTWTEITFDAPVNLVASTKYALVMYGNSAINAIVWRHHTTSQYPGGNKLISNDSGSTWADVAGDYCFEIDTGEVSDEWITKAAIDDWDADIATHAAIAATVSVQGHATTVQITKLDGIETGATKYPDTGEQSFLDADHTKLDGIEAGAQVNSVNDPSADEKAALAGTSGTPSGTNKYVTDSDPRNDDARVPTAHDHDDDYLNKANTDAFTPDADYEPATKKYVDDNAGGVSEGTVVALILGLGG